MTLRGVVGAAFLILASCAVPPTSPGAPSGDATALPSPPDSSLVAFPGTPRPVTNSTPSIILEPPEFVLTPTPTRISLPLPQERIVLHAPGPGSQVTSPVRVTGWSGPAYAGKIYVRLLGEQGQVIGQATTYLLANEDSAGTFLVLVPFAIADVAEAGLVEVSYRSPIDNQVEHIHARPVVFLSVGPSLIYTDPGAPEQLTIFSPRDNRRVSGGVARVQGGGWVDEDLPLVVEVLDRSGEVVGSAEVELEAPVVGELGTFDVEVPFSIPRAQYGRIAVIERSQRPVGIRHYTSVRVYLEP
jgi:hypothetical protein